MPLLRVRILEEGAVAVTPEAPPPSRLAFRSTVVRAQFLTSIKDTNLDLPPLQMDAAQRRALCVDTGLSEEDVASLDLEKLTFASLCEHGVRLPNVRAAGMDLRRLTESAGSLSIFAGAGFHVSRVDPLV